ncbi:hypothetical protein ACFOQM_23245 [Paenibacillus sp. GCM10012307]|uniref:Uncharacterized protein n=1 Tax=Paenibacillus roseus TaxID=2798579 RepID=A0A934J3L6_9BACL|nr:hypothetical protein [Paenibacillus roseus]MBJ6364141.1 hypothetical protein [Paenibacillus roseus]
MNLKPMYKAVANSPITELAAAINDTVTTITLLTSNSSVIPDAPGIVTIGTDSNAETIYYAGKSGNSLTGVTRGFSGTTAKSWPINTKVARFATSYDLNTLKENVEALGAQATESATLQAQLVRGVNKIETDQASPLDGTVYGRTMQNIIPPQRFEANNSAWALSGGTVQYDNTVGNYEIGSAAAKVTLSSDSTSFFYSTALPVLHGNKCFIAVARYKNGNLAGGLTIGVAGAGDYLVTESNSRVNSTSFTTVSRRFKTLKDVPANLIRIGPYTDGGETGQFCWLDAMAIFEISEAEYNIPRAQWDDNRYPYIDGMQSVRGVLIEHPGRNLVPPFLNGMSGVNYRSGYEFDLAINGLVYFLLPVIPNETYAIQCDTNHSDAQFAVYEDAANPASIISYTRSTTTFNVGNRSLVRIYFRCRSSATEAASFKNPVIVLGGISKLPPSFVPREDQRIIIDEVLRSVGGLSDQVNLARHQVTRLVGVWRPDSSGTYTLDSYSGVYVPRIAIPADASKSTLPVMVRYDGLMIRIGAPSTDGPNVVSSYNWGQGTLAFSVANADSGWSGTLTPNQNAIKALLNGWRAAGNSGTAYNAWVSILDGSAPPTNTEAYVAANKAPGWTAYATLQYQLVNPVTSAARIEGVISLHSGVNSLEMKEAAMLREKANPALDSASGVYRLNFTTLPASVFKRPAETILAIYKGTDIDRKWTILTNATSAKGITRAHIPIADYDLSAEYFVTYIVLDRYAYSAAISAATAFYAGNLGSAVSANTQQLARESTRNDIQDWRQTVDGAHIDNLRLDLDEHRGKGGSTHPLATKDDAGFLSPAGFEKLRDIQAGAQVNVVTKVAGKTGDVSLVKADVGLGSVDNNLTATQAEAEAGTATNRFMTPQRTKQAIDTRLLNNVSFRMNNGMLEYNDGTGWKSVGDVDYTPYSAFPEITLSGSGQAWQTLVDITGEGNIERALLTSNTSVEHEFRITVDGIVKLYVTSSASNRVVGQASLSSGPNPVVADGVPYFVAMSIGGFGFSSFSQTFNASGPPLWGTTTLQSGVCLTAAPVKFKSSLKIEVRGITTSSLKVRATVFGGVK